MVRYFVLIVLFAVHFTDTLHAQVELNPSIDKFKTREEIINASVAGYQSISETPYSKPLLQESPARKSRGRAFLQSLLLPGWGQYYAESKKSMRLFIITEVLSLGSYIGFTTWSNWLENDYRAFAVTHADVELNGKDDNYFVDIGNYDNIDDYNQAQLRDRDLVDVYRNTEFYYWQWDTEANREKFDDLRIRSDRAANNSEFALAAIILNHVVSAIHSTLSVYKYNKKLSEQETGFNLNFQYDQERQLFSLNLSKTLR